MMTPRCTAGRAMMVGVFAWAATIAPPARAGSLVESPTSVGTLNVQQAAGPAPISTLTLGGALLNNFFEGRYGGSYADSILKFDLTSLAPGTQITSATFTFSVAMATPTTGTTASLNVGGFGSSSPTVSIPDFSSALTPVGTTGNLPLGTVDQTFHFDVQNLVQSLVNGHTADAGFLTSTSPQADVMIFGDDPANAASFRPVLSIAYISPVPEPSGLLLASLGLIGLVGLARRYAA